MNLQVCEMRRDNRRGTLGKQCQGLLTTLERTILCALGLAEDGLESQRSDFENR